MMTRGGGVRCACGYGGGMRRVRGGGTTRAQQKLLDFVRYLKYSFDGKIVLDIGSSTGGFTQVALDMGAKKVVAVEKGTKQMRAPLRYDARVELHEKTDIFEFTPDGEIDVVVADVSFVSLKPILKDILGKVDQGTEFLVMMKPQFEAKPSELNRGVVKNERMRRGIIKDFEAWLKSSGFIIKDRHDNEVTGRNGNRERFYYLAVATPLV
ncbi:TlyA family RNA methyltransferase [Candidatus Saccharibacteria bacterium]|nr:TlyA family RNA methyltransferase [Candidatus Saccharibacteria bacterium]